MITQDYVEWVGKPHVYSRKSGWGLLVGERYYEFTPTGHLSEMGRITPEYIENITKKKSSAERGFSAAGTVIRKNITKRPETGEEGNGKRRIHTGREAGSGS